MSQSILYELFNNTVKSGTGIATYSRNLTRVAKKLGYRVGGLFHVSRGVSRKDAILSEVEFFDSRERKGFDLSKYLLFARCWAFGAPLGVKTTSLSRMGVVLEGRAASGPAEEEFDQRLVARHFSDVSRLHFKRYGACASLRLPTRPDLFHATQAIALHAPGAANVYTIHDLVPLRLPNATLDDKKFFLQLTRHLCRTADHIVTVSEASRRDLIEIAGAAPERVTNTYQAVEFPRSVVEMGESQVANLVQGMFELEYKEYFLFYGAIEPKKNIGRLIDAHLGSGSKRPLVIAGGLGWEYEEELARLEELPTHNYRVFDGRIAQERKILRVGRLPLFQLVSLIRGARAVLFPSLYEGFGLPALESMLLGTPVMTSNVSSLTEVSGDAALLVDPYDVAAMSKAIKELDADDDLRAEMSKRGIAQAREFSPARYEERMSALYGKILLGK